MQACDLVIFGTNGDLARRKLLPGLYQLEKAKLIAPDSTIIGVAREASTDFAALQGARPPSSLPVTVRYSVLKSNGHRQQS